jgi:haloalkane dehalogenase
MEVLRTPDSCFENIKNYPYKPIYTNIETKDGTSLRIHHIDEGPKEGPILLAMHGQPVWSYIYTKMIPFLTAAGIRVIAPDLPGYGKSDKPAAREDYSYQNQVDWMVNWLDKNDFRNLTFFWTRLGRLNRPKISCSSLRKFYKSFYWQYRASLQP